MSGFPNKTTFVKVAFAGSPALQSPSSSWVKGQGVIDTAGVCWVCTVSGVPGTWIEVAAATGDITSLTSSDSSLTITNPAGPVADLKVTNPLQTVAVEDKGGAVFNVKAYGAKGDGTTDDTASIQSAITAAAVSGGIVFLPQGTYKLTKGSNTYCLLLATNVTIMGAGVGVTILSSAQQNGAINTSCDVLAGTSLSNVTVRDLTITGNAGTGNAADSNNGAGVYLQSITGFFLYNLQINYMRQIGIQIGTSNGGGACINGIVDNIECVGYHSAVLNVATGNDIAISNVISPQTGAGVLVENGPCNRIAISNVDVVAYSGGGATADYGFQVLANTGAISSVMATNIKVFGPFVACRFYASKPAATPYNITDLVITNLLVDPNNGAGNSDGCDFLVDSGCVIDGLTVTNAIVRNALNYGFHLTGITGSFLNCLAELNGKEGWYTDTTCVLELTQCDAIDNGGSSAGTYPGFHFNATTATMVNCRSQNVSHPTYQTYGIRLDATTTKVNAILCDFSGNATNSVLVQNNGSNVVYCSHCKGVNPTTAVNGAAVFALGASTVAWTNTTGVDGTLYTTGVGAATAVSVNGVAVSGTLGVGDTFRIVAGGTFTVTYTVAPSFTFVGD